MSWSLPLPSGWIRTGLVLGAILATSPLRGQQWNRILPSAGRIGDVWGDVASSFDVEPERPDDDVRAVVKRHYFRNSPEGKILVQASAIQFTSAAVARKRFQKLLSDQQRLRSCPDLPDAADTLGLPYSERTALFDRYWLRTQQSGLGEDYKAVLQRLLALVQNPEAPRPTPSP